MLSFGMSVRVGLLGEASDERLGAQRPRLGPGVLEVKEPAVDVFDEGDHLLVVAELPGARAADIDFEVDHDVLSFSTQGVRRYTKEILLPTPVLSPEGAICRNGVFYLKLLKAA